MSICIDLKDDRSERVKYDGKYPIYVRRGLLSNYPNYSAPSHWHDDIEFILILSGEMDYNINGEIVRLKTGDGLFVNARQMHFGFSEKHIECDFICILLHPKLLCAYPDMENNYIAPVTRNQKFPFSLLSSEVPWQSEICNYIWQIYQIRDTAAYVMRTHGLFALIWSLLLENSPDYSETKPVEDRDIAVFKNMVGFIQQHYPEKITLSAIARAGNIGESKCCKLFHKYLSNTPNDYLIEYRLNKSAEYLRGTDMTVTEIALSTGFTGGSYFAETFRKWLGMTPMEYRRINMPLVR